MTPQESHSINRSAGEQLELTESILPLGDMQSDSVLQPPDA
jgi:hypothetical protein